MGNIWLPMMCVVFPSLLLSCGKAEEQKPVLNVSPSWLTRGASVNLTCKAEGVNSGWKFFWYKAIPGLSYKNYSYSLLPKSSNGTEDDSYIILEQRHTAGYACRAQRDNKTWTGYSEPRFVWSADAHPAASLKVTPDTEKLFTNQSISLKCNGTFTNGRLRSYKEINKKSYLSDCSTWWTINGSSCIINSQSDHEAVYWCETALGHFSNAINITIYKPKAFLTVSPSWLSPGASVNLSCKVDPPSTRWRFYWYKAVPDRKHTYYKYELLTDSISGTVEDSYIIHGQRHTAGYACRAEKPDTFTDYSSPKFVWSAVSIPAASITVYPNREQHFTSEAVKLNCEGNFTHWRVRKFTGTGDLAYIKNCSDWEKMSGPSCTIRSTSYNKAVYWCESGSGDFSNTVNLTITDTNLVLVSPVHPVTEGTPVTLGCQQRRHNIPYNVSFYFNENLLQTDSSGELNISEVSQADEGFYKCKNPGNSSSPSWMAIKTELDASRSESSSLSLVLVLGAVSGSIFITLLLLLLCFRKSTDSCHQRVTQSESTDHSSFADQPNIETETNENIFPLHDLDSDNSVNSDATESNDITYSRILVKSIKLRERHHDIEEQAVYSEPRRGAAVPSENRIISPTAADAAVYSEVRRCPKE